MVGFAGGCREEDFSSTAADEAVAARAAVALKGAKSRVESALRLIVLACLPRAGDHGKGASFVCFAFHGADPVIFDGRCAEVKLDGNPLTTVAIRLGRVKLVGVITAAVLLVVVGSEGGVEAYVLFVSVPLRFGFQDEIGIVLVFVTEFVLLSTDFACRVLVLMIGDFMGGLDVAENVDLVVVLLLVGEACCRLDARRWE